MDTVKKFLLFLTENELVDENLNLASHMRTRRSYRSRSSKTITNLYPHGMAEFGSRIQDNAYKTEEGATVMQQMNGVVPHQIKSGVAQWDYGKMDAGAYYYHPGIKAFVQRQPGTDETPAQLIVINPYTFKEVRRQNLE